MFVARQKPRKTDKRQADIRRIFGLAKKVGMGEDDLRTLAAQISPARKKDGSGSISLLISIERKKLIEDLNRKVGGAKSGWTAGPGQVRFINFLHYKLREAGVLQDTKAFMEKTTGRSVIEHLPRQDANHRHSARGYIEVLKSMCAHNGIVIQ